VLAYVCLRNILRYHQYFYWIKLVGMFICIIITLFLWNPGLVTLMVICDYYNILFSILSVSDVTTYYGVLFSLYLSYVIFYTLLHIFFIVAYYFYLREMQLDHHRINCHQGRQLAQNHMTGCFCSSYKHYFFFLSVSSVILS